jgi:thiamine monophosphate kinase
VRQARIGLAHGGGQRIHDLALDAVGEMARIRDILEAAPAVGDLLVLGERVGDQREGAQLVLEGRPALRRALRLTRSSASCSLFSVGSSVSSSPST